MPNPAAEAKITQAIALLQQALVLLAPPADADVLMLARAIQGEGAAAFGPQRDEVGLWIGHTVLNLYEAPWQAGRWPTVADVVLDRFHGHVNVLEPADWALAIAHSVLRCDRDPTCRAQAMLSLADLQAHDWPVREDILIRAFTTADGRQLRFYRTWAEEWE